MRIVPVFFLLSLIVSGSAYMRAQITIANGMRIGTGTCIGRIHFFYSDDNHYAEDFLEVRPLFVEVQSPHREIYFSFRLLLSQDSRFDFAGGEQTYGDFDSSGQNWYSHTEGYYWRYSEEFKTIGILPRFHYTFLNQRPDRVFYAGLAVGISFEFPFERKVLYNYYTTYVRYGGAGWEYWNEEWVWTETDNEFYITTSATKQFKIAKSELIAGLDFSLNASLRIYRKIELGAEIAARPYLQHLVQTLDGSYVQSFTYAGCVIRYNLGNIYSATLGRP